MVARILSPTLRRAAARLPVAVVAFAALAVLVPTTGTVAATPDEPPPGTTIPADESSETGTTAPVDGEPDTGTDEPETTIAGTAIPGTTVPGTTADTVPLGTTAPDTSEPAVAVTVPVATTVDLPPGPPPGFTEEQYRSFVDVVRACGFDTGWVCDRVLALTGSAAAAETAQWLFDVPVRLVLVLLAAFGINRIVRRAIERYTRRVAGRSTNDPGADATAIRRDALRVTTAAGTIGRAATIVIAVIAALIMLAELDITLGPLLAGAGIVGIALGFGAQNLVRDVLAGIFVVFEDQYGVGDIIDAGRATGVVEEVTLRITKVRDVEGTLWFIPNGTIPEVGNKTQLWARAIIDFDIDYRADHELAGRIIKDTADRLWRDDACEVRILEEPELWGVESLGDSAVVIRLAVKCAPAQQWKLARTLRGEVKKALDDAGIEIPFPQHTIWVHGDPESVEAATSGTVDRGR